MVTVVGNKSDLESKRQVSREEGEQFAKENDLFFMEASAKSAENVEDAFVKTAQNIYKKIQSGVIDLSSEVKKEIVAWMKRETHERGCVHSPMGSRLHLLKADLHCHLRMLLRVAAVVARALLPFIHPIYLLFPIETRKH